MNDIRKCTPFEFFSFYFSFSAGNELYFYFSFIFRPLDDTDFFLCVDILEILSVLLVDCSVKETSSSQNATSLICLRFGSCITALT